MAGARCGAAVYLWAVTPTKKKKIKQPHNLAVANSRGLRFLTSRT